MQLIKLMIQLRKELLMKVNLLEKLNSRMYGSDIPQERLTGSSRDLMSRLDAMKLLPWLVSLDAEKVLWLLYFSDSMMLMKAEF